MLISSRSDDVTDDVTGVTDDATDDVTDDVTVLRRDVMTSLKGAGAHCACYLRNPLHMRTGDKF